jgi:hypothetical protein
MRLTLSFIFSFLFFATLNSVARAQPLPEGWTITSSKDDSMLFSYKGGEAIIGVLAKADIAPNQMDLDAEAMSVASQLTNIPGCVPLASAKPIPIISKQGRKLETPTPLNACAIYILQTGPRSMRMVFAQQNSDSSANARGVALDLLQRGVNLPSIAGQASSTGEGSAEAELKVALARVPASHRPMGYFDRDIQTASGINGMTQTHTVTWMVFANGYATDCFEGWDPEFQAPTPQGLAALSKECSIEKWRKIGEEYEIVYEDGDTQSFNLSMPRKFKPGQRVQASMKSYGSSIAMIGYISVSTSDLILDQSGTLRFSKLNQQWQGGGNDTSRQTDVANYYFDGYMAAVRYPNGTIQKFFVSHSEGKKSATGEFDYIYWNGALFGREEEEGQ